MIKPGDRFVAAFTNASMTLIGGLYVMLAVGIAHHEWWPAVPTIGYLWSTLIVFLLRCSFGVTKSREVAQDREDKELRKSRRTLARHLSGIIGDRR